MSVEKEDKGMDPVVVSSLITLATQIAGLAIKYNDSNLEAPTVEALQAHLAEFEKIAPLPETYDVGFVSGIMGQVMDFFNQGKK